MPTTRSKIRRTSRPTPLRRVTVRGRRQLELRSRLAMDRERFARLAGVSTRTLASIEGGQDPSDALQRKLTQVRRLINALADVIDPDSVGPWMTTPNEAFDGLKPLEVIERGEDDRIWQMIYLLRSGAAS